MKKHLFVLSLLLIICLSACQVNEVQPRFIPDSQITVTPMTYAPKAPAIIADQPGRITTFDVSLEKYMIAFGTSNGVAISDFTTYEHLKWFFEGEMISSLAWSPDGEYLAVGTLTGISEVQGQADLIILDTQTWEVTDFQIDKQDIINERFLDLAWSPDGTMLAAGTDIKGVLVWDIPTGAVVSHQVDFSSSVRDVDWSPDGTRLIASSDQAYGIRRWIWKTDKAVRLFDQRNSSAMAVAWSPDGTRIASGHIEGRVCIWTAATNMCDGLIQAHRSAIYDLAWSPDSTKLATVNGVIRVWDTSDGSLLYAFGEYDDLRYIKIEWPALDAPLVTQQEGLEDGSISIVRFWDIATGKIMVEFQARPE
jgi:WD40 repeat protein